MEAGARSAKGLSDERFSEGRVIRMASIDYPLELPPMAQPMPQADTTALAVTAAAVVVGVARLGPSCS